MNDVTCWFTPHFFRHAKHISEKNGTRIKDFFLKTIYIYNELYQLKVDVSMLNTVKNY